MPDVQEKMFRLAREWERGGGKMTVFGDSSNFGWMNGGYGKMIVYEDEDLELIKLRLSLSMQKSQKCNVVPICKYM